MIRRSGGSGSRISVLAARHDDDDDDEDCYGTYLHGNGLCLLNIYRLYLTLEEITSKQESSIWIYVLILRLKKCFFFVEDIVNLVIVGYFVEDLIVIVIAIGLVPLSQTTVICLLVRGVNPRLFCHSLLLKKNPKTIFFHLISFEFQLTTLDPNKTFDFTPAFKQLWRSLHHPCRKRTCSIA